MGKIILDQVAFGLSTVMERITRVRVKDCFRDEDTIYFVVSAQDLGKAIGKGAVNIKKLQDATRKKVRIIGFDQDVVKFVQNIIQPLKVEQIDVTDETVTLNDSNKKTKNLLRGRGGKTVKLLNRAVKRFFNKGVEIGK